MLVLSRTRSSEVILIDAATGREIARVRVSDIRGDNVKLGFTADSNVKIMRAELVEDGPDAVAWFGADAPDDDDLTNITIMSGSLAMTGANSPSLVEADFA